MVNTYKKRKGHGRLLAIFRMLRNLRDKEHYLRTRYQKEHPHFYLYLALDAILTVIISTSLYSVAFGNGILDREPHIQVDLGSVPIDLTQVKEQARDHKVTFYWIGEAKSKRYTTVLTDSESVALNYLTDSRSDSGNHNRILTVVTYPSEESFRNNPKGPLLATQDISATNARGDRISYNLSELTRIEVMLSADPSVVILEYPREQSVEQLLADSEKIVPLK
jgi:hypothetical protein